MITHAHPPTSNPSALRATCVANLQAVLLDARTLRERQADLLRAGHQPRAAAILMDGGHLQEHLISRTFPEAQASAALMADLIEQVAALPPNHPAIQAAARHVSEHGHYRPGASWRWAIRTDFVTNLGPDRVATMTEAITRDFRPRPSPMSDDQLREMDATVKRITALGAKASAPSGAGLQGTR